MRLSEQVAGRLRDGRKLLESAEEFRKLGREDRGAAARRDLEVVEKWRMDPEQFEALVREIIEQNDHGPRDIGQVMKAVMGVHGDVVDGWLARQTARRLLQERD